MKTLMMAFLVTAVGSHALADVFDQAQEKAVQACLVEFADYNIDREECILRTSPFLISLSEELWTFGLIENGCKETLEKEIADIFDEYELTKDTTFEYPETVGYQYFNVLFKNIRGEDYEYQFSYGTDDDLHVKCTSVSRLQFIY